jgi:hypothetical protein
MAFTGSKCFRPALAHSSSVLFPFRRFELFYSFSEFRSRYAGQILLTAGVLASLFVKNLFMSKNEIDRR